MQRLITVTLVLLLVAVSWMLPPTLTLANGAGSVILPLHRLAEVFTWLGWVCINALKGHDRATLAAL